MNKPMVVIGIPVGAYVDPDFTTSLAGICYQRSDLFEIAGLYNSKGCYVTMNRDRLAKMFLDRKEGDWFLTLDTDLSFPQTLLIDLFKLVNETKAKVVAGWYYGRFKEDDIRPLIYHKDKKGFWNTHPNHNDSPTKVEGVATGCLLMHKEVLERVPRDKTGRIFYFGDTGEEFEEADHSPLGEDLMFSLNCGKAGYDIYTRRSLHLTHHKIKGY